MLFGALSAISFARAIAPVALVGRWGSLIDCQRFLTKPPREEIERTLVAVAEDLSQKSEKRKVRWTRHKRAAPLADDGRAVPIVDAPGNAGKFSTPPPQAFDVPSKFHHTPALNMEMIDPPVATTSE